MPKLPAPFLILILLAALSADARADAHFDDCYNRTGHNATVILPAATIDLNGATMTSGDELAIFTSGGVCAGHVVWQGANAALAVWQDDPMTEMVEGFVTGESLVYAVWDASDGVEYGRDYGSVNVSYDVAFATNGSFESDAIFLISEMVVSSHEIDEADSPIEFALDTNFPNPFSGRTTIRYELSHSSPVKLEVYNMLGHRVGVLVDDVRPAGTHEVSFVADQGLASGVYVYRLQAGQHTSHRKMVLVN